MASVVELEAVIVIAAFIFGGVCGVLFIVANGIRAQEKVARYRAARARDRARVRQRATTLYDEPTSNLTRGVHWLTGAGHDPWH